MSEIEVRVRHIDDATPVPFLSWELNDISNLIEKIKYEGGIYVHGDYYTNITTQLVLDKGIVFYELILEEDGE